jgi:hypothetical protein
MIGYAFQLEEIFRTTDGGKTWSQAAANRYVTSLPVTRENVMCASFNSSLSETTPSTPGTLGRPPERIVRYGRAFKELIRRF